MTGHVAGNVAAGTLRPQPLTLAETPLASDLAGASLVSDSELVRRTGQGDRRSFGTLYLRHLDVAWRVACNSAATAADAEDAVAEGFAKVFAALPRMVDRDLAFRPYLLACVRNAAVDRHRRTRKIDLRDEVPDHAAVTGDPDEIVLADLDRNLVGEALQSLPERWRTVLWLTEVEGMTPMEVSAVIGIRPNAVAALSYRAREALRQAYLQAHVRVEAKTACRYTVDRLGPYVRNKLAGRERDKIQAHLDSCATCRQRRDELADVNASLLGTLVPIPLLLGSTTQQEWLSVTRPGKGKAKRPAKAAKAAQPGTSPTVQRTRTVVVALLLAVSGGVALESSGPGGRVGKPLDPVAIPEHSSPATPPPDELAPIEEALPPPVPNPTATPPSRRVIQAPVRLDAPVPAPQPQLVEGPGPGPEPVPTLTPPPQAPPPPTPTPTPAVAAVRISVGEGDRGVVVALSIPSEPADNPRPDLDVTVGRTPLVGDEPPSEGTGVDVSLAPITALFSLNGLHTR